MEYSLEQLHAKVENLTAAVLATIALETLQRKSVDIDRNEILAELNDLAQLIRTNGRGTVAQQAERSGLTIFEPGHMRGQYHGPVVGSDYRAMLVQCSRTTAMELPFAALAEGEDRPRFGDSVRIGFKDEVMSVTVVERTSRKPPSET